MVPEVQGAPTGEARASNEYWFVHITGQESRSPGTGLSCGVAFSHSVDEDLQQITYQDHRDRDALAASPQVVVASNVWDASSCPLSYDLVAGGGIGFVTEVFGKIQVQAAPDGTVTVGDTSFQPGQRMVLNGWIEKQERGETVRYEADIIIRAMGAWPHAGLKQQS